jgi:hypothetical protein
MYLFEVGVGHGRVLWWMEWIGLAGLPCWRLSRYGNGMALNVLNVVARLLARGSAAVFNGEFKSSCGSYLRVLPRDVMFLTLKDQILTGTCVGIICNTTLSALDL